LLSYFDPLFIKEYSAHEVGDYVVHAHYKINKTKKDNPPMSLQLIAEPYSRYIWMSLDEGHDISSSINIFIDKVLPDFHAINKKLKGIISANIWRRGEVMGSNDVNAFKMFLKMNNLPIIDKIYRNYSGAFKKIYHASLHTIVTKGSIKKEGWDFYKTFIDKHLKKHNHQQLLYLSYSQAKTPWEIFTGKEEENLILI
jgi:hypothetical protein